MELTPPDTHPSRRKIVLILHRCRIPGGLSNRFRPGPGAIGIEAEDTLGKESSKVTASVEAGTLSLLTADLIHVAPSWLSGCILPSLMVRRSVKCFSTSIFFDRGSLARSLSFCSYPLRPLSGPQRAMCWSYCRLPIACILLGFQLLRPIRPVPLSGSSPAVQRRLSFGPATGEVLPNPVHA